jgi:hypothetical protein
LVLGQEVSEVLGCELVHEPQHPSPFGHHHGHRAGQGKLLRGRARWRKHVREAVYDQLVDPLRPVEVLEPVLAQVAQADSGNLHVVDDPSSGPRKQHLAAVRNRADASRAMDGDSRVAVRGDIGLAGVQTYPDGERSFFGPLFIHDRPLSCN